MEAKLTAAAEATLSAALSLAKLSDGDPAALLLFAGHGIDLARAEIAEFTPLGKPVGVTYHALAAMSLLACAAYLELQGDL